MQIVTSERTNAPLSKEKDQKFFDFYAAFRSRTEVYKAEVDSGLYASLKRVSLVYESSLNERPVISSSSDAISFFQRYWSQVILSDQERFVVACLGTKNRVQCVVEVTVGTLDASLVHPREVFKPAFIEGSSSIILSHNHPSGNPTPSREDIAVTDRLTEAGKLLGIDVLDHVIYGDCTGEAISIRECE